jgi:hypothetical protein
VATSTATAPNVSRDNGRRRRAADLGGSSTPSTRAHDAPVLMAHRAEADDGPPADVSCCLWLLELMFPLQEGAQPRQGRVHVQVRICALPHEPRIQLQGNTSCT